MSSCRKWRHHLVEAIYDELEGERRASLEPHLASCPRCADELERLSATADHIAEALPPRPQAGELDVWNRIAPRLDAIDHPERPGYFFGPRLTLGYPTAAALAVLLLAMGLSLGLFLRTPAPHPTTPFIAEVDTAGVEFARYLQRSTPLLLAITNRRIGGSLAEAGFDGAAERQLAERLAIEATEISTRLEEQDRPRQAALLSDLAIVFLQIANLPEQEYRHGIEMVQATIESRALLFQLSVEEMRRL